MADIPKFYLHVSNRMTTGPKLAKVGDVIATMESILKRSCDSVEVHTTYEEGENWESFTVVYDTMFPELQRFIDDVGDSAKCIFKGKWSSGDTWSWDVVIDNQLQQPFKWPDFKAPLKVFTFV